MAALRDRILSVLATGADRAVGTRRTRRTACIRAPAEPLLLDELALKPAVKNARYALAGDGEQALSIWQQAKLRLTWCERERPWEVEQGVIARLHPPLNAAGNAAHLFHARVREARSAATTGDIG